LTLEFVPALTAYIQGGYCMILVRWVIIVHQCYWHEISWI